MKNIETSVGVIPTQEKKEEVEKVEEEEEYTEHRNEMYFFLEEHPEYRISAVGRWLENSKGEVVGDADTYFYHITNGSRCDSVGECLDGWSEQNEEAEEKWETLAYRLRVMLRCDLRRIVCGEKKYEIHPV